MKLFSSKKNQSQTTSEDKPQGLFARLGKTREGLFAGITQLFKGEQINDSVYDDIEDQLLVADLGFSVTQKIVTQLRQQSKANKLKDADAVRDCLRDVLLNILLPCESEPIPLRSDRPVVMMMVGVNGVGKTTTMAKIAHQFKQRGHKVILGACDTFRAAAIEQLQSWGQKLGVSVIAQAHGSDAAAVAFDAYSAASARQCELLLIDTAGRQHTHGDLVEQLKKVKRVLAKADDGVPDEVWITVDAGNGQNVLSQVEHFHDAVALTGVCVTKLDGTAKGGVLIALADRFAIPIRYIGVGESEEDLRHFNAREFVDALLPDMSQQTS